MPQPIRTFPLFAVLSFSACGGLDPAAEALFCSDADPCVQPVSALLLAHEAGGVGGGSAPASSGTGALGSSSSSSGSPSDAGVADAYPSDAGPDGPSCAHCRALLTEEASESDACPDSLAFWHAYVSCACDFGEPCYGACAVDPHGYCEAHRWQDAGPSCAACQVGACGAAYWACNDDK